MLLNPSLTTDEVRVLEAILAGTPHADVLRSQIADAAITREWTGVGFFVDFAPPIDVESAPMQGRQTLEASGTMAGIDCGFILFVNEGLVEMLECYTCSSEALPDGASLETVRTSTT